jgi:hypothetical protein
VASVEWLPDTDPDPDSEAIRGKLASAARSAHERYHSTGVRGDNYDAPPEDIEIEQLAYTLADDCALTVEDRLALLAETDPLARLRLVRSVLLRETRFLRELRAIPAPLTEFAQTPGMN